VPGELELSSLRQGRRFDAEIVRTAAPDEGPIPLTAARLERHLERVRDALDSASRELREARTQYHAMRSIVLEAEQAAKSATSLTVLTRQEYRIAQLAASGRGYSDVAAAASISPHTVKSHMKRVFRKLGVHSRWELARRMSIPQGDV
jgi:DNA-binding CsgD family transcriptional regulator